MEFLRVWRGLSSGQRGYISMFGFWMWLAPVMAITEIGKDNGAALQFLWLGLGCGLFATILYFSVRRAALSADSQGGQTGNELYTTGGLRPIAQLPGSPSIFVIALGVAGAFSTFMIMGEQGPFAGLGALVVFGAFTLYMHRCAKTLTRL